MRNIAFHIDVNSAFPSWEAVYRLYHRGGTLDLREIPSAVGGDVSLRHGIILAKSIPAENCGVKTGQTLSGAKQSCPNLMLVPPDYSLHVAELSKEYAALLVEKKQCYEEYRAARQEMIEYQTAKHNVDIILGMDKAVRKKQQNMEETKY